MNVTPIPLNQFREEMLVMYRPPLRTKATFKLMEHTFRQLDAAGGVQTTADLNTAAIARVIARRPASESRYTLQGILRRLRCVANFAVTSGYLAVSPFAVRPVHKWVRVGPPGQKLHFSRDEIRQVLAQASGEARSLKGWPGWRARRLEALVNIASYTGLRKMELLHLHVEDLDLERRCILVIDRGREGGNSLKTLAAAQPVPIPEVLVPIVEAWLLHRLDVPTGFRIPEFVPWLIPNLKRTGAWTGGPLRSKPTDCVKNLAARAGIQGMTLQSLRRSLATHLEGHGMGQPLISRILRHTTPETSLRWYQKADIPNLVQSVRDFSYDA